MNPPFVCHEVKVEQLLSDLELVDSISFSKLQFVMHLCLDLTRGPLVRQSFLIEAVLLTKLWHLHYCGISRGGEVAGAQEI